MQTNFNINENKTGTEFRERFFYLREQLIQQDYTKRRNRFYNISITTIFCIEIVILVLLLK